MKNIILLGATGSVGRNVLEVVERHPDKFRIKSISASENVSLLSDQVKRFMPEDAVIGNEGLYGGLKNSVPAGVRAAAGPEELERIAAEEADIVFIAISGRAALRPLIAALKAGRTVALASKEPVVSAGVIIQEIVAETSAVILPVDSEHSAIMQCLSGRKSEDVETLYITGSGGALHSRDEEDFESLSQDEVLDHPKWDMGRKITVDSATLMNKGLEAIEARWLFDVPAEKIKVVIHPQAIIHSMVEFVDGTIQASLFCPDMKFPILRALSYPDIIPSDLPRVDFTKLKELTFSEPDTRKFPALEMAFEALRSGGTMPAALNSANESAVKLFLEERMRFTDIIPAVKDVLEKHENIEAPALEDIVKVEDWAAEEVLASCCR